MGLIASDPDLLSDIEADVEELRTSLAGRRPSELYGPVAYVLASGGKRFRPILVHLVAASFGTDRRSAAPLALAVEVFHNFTLVHDDIMDNASMRRGRPTVHEKWDSSTAILAGDLLLGVSYDLLSRAPSQYLSELMQAFGTMVSRLCEGQALDMSFENRESIDLEEYLEMIDGKTGALLECCMQLGAIVSGADTMVTASLASAGRELGRAFQIQDDLLDLVAEDAKWGKTVGGDLIEGKKAYLLLKALECSDFDTRNWFRNVSVSGLGESEVDVAREKLEQAGVLRETAEAVKKHCLSATSKLSVLPNGEAKSRLIAYVDALGRRTY